VVGKILEHDTYAYGYDAQTGEFGNLVSKGIIDPTKVVRIALQDASSIAGLLITTEAMVAELPKKESPTPAMPGGGMGGMDYSTNLVVQRDIRRPGFHPGPLGIPRRHQANGPGSMTRSGKRSRGSSKAGSLWRRVVNLCAWAARLRV